MSRKPPRERSQQPTQYIADYGKGFAGGVHFHGDVSIVADFTDSAKDYAAGYASLRRHQEDALARLLAAPLVSNSVTESSLLNDWRRLGSSPDWYDSVVQHGATVVKALDHEWPESSSINQWYEEVRSERRTFAVVYAGLKRFNWANTLERIRERREGETSERGRLIHRAGFQSCRWLIQQLASPTFNTTLNLAGQFGSGRSQILRDISKRALEDGSLAFLLPRKRSEEIGAAIYRYVADGSGIAVKCFEDLARFLEAAPTQSKLYILVDDVDVWTRPDGAADDLQALIDASTQCGRIRWVLAADRSGLDAVVGADPYFWVRHGILPSVEDHPSRPALDRTTGWRDVDAANRAQKIGFEILRANSSKDLADIDEVANDPEAFDYEFTHLANPLAAWIRLATYGQEQSASGPIQSITDVNSSEFVRSYWRWVKGRISPQDENRRAALERAVRLLTNLLLDRPGEPAELDASTAANNGEAIAGLVAGGIIRTGWVGNPELHDQTLRIEPTFPALLGLRVARAQDDQARVENARSAWWPLAREGQRLAESICQFTLMPDAPSWEVDGQLWQEWSRAREAPKVPLLMAAPACSDSAVQATIDCIARDSYKPETKRECFMLLQFVAKARLATWKADQRIAAMRPHEKSVCEAGLETYLLFTIRLILESNELVDEANYIRICQALDGYLQPSVRELAANLMVAAGSRIYADDESAWIDALLRYCKKQAKGNRARQPDRRNRRGKWQGPTSSAVPAFESDRSFAVPLTSAIARYVVQARGGDGVRMLAKKGWWTAESKWVNPALAAHMRQTLTVEYGRSVHRLRANDPRFEEYKLIVRDLLNGQLLFGGAEGGRIAFYLLKHSVPTYGQADVLIRPELLPQLRKIGKDGALMKRIGSGGETLMRANGV